MKRNLTTNFILEFVNFYASGATQKECMEKFKISQKTLLKYLKQQNVKLRTFSETFGIDKNKEKCIKNDYLAGLDSSQISLKYNINTRTVLNILKRNGVTMRKKPGAKRTYSLNDDYFEKIDSKDKAYFLGLILADGWIQNNTCSVALKEQDKQILEVFKEYIQSNKPLYFKKKQKETWQNQYSISLISKKLIKDLETYGIKNAKTDICIFPNIPEQFYSHFIRGVFDGDGSIGLYEKGASFNIINSKQVIEKIENIFINLLGIKPTKIIKHKTKTVNNIYAITKNSKKDIITIYNWLYSNCGNLYLKRKKEKFEEIWKQ